jgi:hypothetical protein
MPGLVTGLFWDAYATGGFPLARNNAFKASVNSACCVVSSSAASSRSCFLAVAVVQNGIDTRPVRSGRLMLSALVSTTG